MSSILVKLPNWIGDILFSYDLLYSLSSEFDRIGLLVSVSHADLLVHFPIPRCMVISYPPQRWPNLNRATILEIQRFRPDCGLLLPNSFGSALILRYAGVSPLYGYDTEHRGFLLHRSLSPVKWKLHQTNYYLGLLKLFGLPAKTYPANGSIAKSGPIVLHPGASKPERAWHLDRFVTVAEELQRTRKEVIFVSQQKLNLPFACYRTQSLTELIQLFQQCSLFIGNDSGPLHLAQQCGLPVVGIYGPGDPMITGPRSISRSRVLYAKFSCSPCRQKFFHECDPSPAGKPFCLESVSTHEVVAAALELLS